MDNRLIDIKKFVAPVAGVAPVGEDLRADSHPNSIYYQIKDARIGARMMERKYFEEHDESLKKEIQEAWNTVYKKSLSILENTSKDLEVVTWLIEALARIDGFKGLALGFELAAELIQGYWPAVFPVEDEEGPFSKVMVLAGLNGIDAEGVLELPINCISMTDTNITQNYAFWQYKQSLEVESIEDPDKKQKRYAQGVIPLDVIKKAAEQSGGSFYKKLQEDIEQARLAYQALCSVIEEKSPGIHFPSSTLFKLLDEASEFIGYLSGRKKTVISSTPVTEDIDSKKQDVVLYNRMFSNREEALDQLLVIANYFREVEPQSVLPYVIERANRWGRLSVPELLRAIIGDEKARESLFDLTGIN